ncbi:glycoside hydrolase family 13 protein [Frigoribacterium sp. CFBP9030]|uniref:glycoside hydrolase family 13 protein n=1 Tax=Frigoribacterium sp. CFBP9030 TaxID=3096537 RepID=UPI002A6A819F|nr:glycoside hydrolase family 13 protein [Frigoribacterium sp. CFBP9030]MDY0892068.1 glycoside hydrolase family 13 protein [Frigoribacterium sp. CFBP9030]
MSSAEPTGDTLDAPADSETDTPTALDEAPAASSEKGGEWWRSAVIYQVYPRSFADSDGDGVGDLPGITSRLGDLADLGVDAVWLSPFYRSPQRDAGYDVADYRDVDPLFGTLADFDALRARATDLGLRVIVDVVPNHTSSEHAWFQAALAAEPGSVERGHYLFRDGRGVDGELPPNNWESIFGGPAWTRITEADGTAGQWYLHLFDSSQPDLDWTDPWVREQFVDVLRFWLDRGVDGFRVDVAHGMIKAEGLPDYTPPADSGSMGGGQGDSAPPPYWGQDGVHEIYRSWRKVLDEYEGDRVLVAEAWVEPLSRLAEWVRPDEMHQAFNFSYLETGWSASEIRRVVDSSIEVFSSVGAPSTWVLSNHDVVRHASRLALTAENPQGHGIGPRSAGLPIPELGLARARAATAVMLALPGSAYLYQGEELGLPEAIDLPDESRQDPTWFRTGGERYGRDGCRVPLPWESAAPAFGFNSTGASWLPQPSDWSTYARDEQTGVTGSTLELYRLALRLRSEIGLGTSDIVWLDDYSDEVVAFRSAGVTVLANLGEVAVELPLGDVLLSTMSLDGPALPPNAAVWLRETDV